MLLDANSVFSRGPRIRGQSLISNFVAVPETAPYNNAVSMFFGHPNEDDKVARAMAKQATKKEQAGSLVFTSAGPTKLDEFQSPQSLPIMDSKSTAGSSFETIYNARPQLQFEGHLSEDEKAARAMAKQETKKESFGTIQVLASSLHGTTSIEDLTTKAETSAPTTTLDEPVALNNENIELSNHNPSGVFGLPTFPAGLSPSLNQNPPGPSVFALPVMSAEISPSFNLNDPGTVALPAVSTSQSPAFDNEFSNSVETVDQNPRVIALPTSETPPPLNQNSPPTLTLPVISVSTSLQSSEFINELPSSIEGVDQNQAIVFALPTVSAEMPALLNQNPPDTFAIPIVSVETLPFQTPESTNEISSPVEAVNQNQPSVGVHAIPLVAGESPSPLNQQLTDTFAIPIVSAETTPSQSQWTNELTGSVVMNENQPNAFAPTVYAASETSPFLTSESINEFTNPVEVVDQHQPSVFPLPFVSAEISHPLNHSPLDIFAVPILSVETSPSQSSQFTNEFTSSVEVVTQNQPNVVAVPSVYVESSPLPNEKPTGILVSEASPLQTSGIIVSEASPLQTSEMTDELASSVEMADEVFSLPTVSVVSPPLNRNQPDMFAVPIVSAETAPAQSSHLFTSSVEEVKQNQPNILALPSIHGESLPSLNQNPTGIIVPEASPYQTSQWTNVEQNQPSVFTLPVVSAEKIPFINQNPTDIYAVPVVSAEPYSLQSPFTIEPTSSIVIQDQPNVFALPTAVYAESSPSLNKNSLEIFSRPAGSETLPFQTSRSNEFTSSVEVYQKPTVLAFPTLYTESSPLNQNPPGILAVPETSPFQASESMPIVSAGTTPSLNQNPADIFADPIVAPETLPSQLSQHSDEFTSSVEVIQNQPNVFALPTHAELSSLNQNPLNVFALPIVSDETSPTLNQNKPDTFSLSIFSAEESSTPFQNPLDTPIFSAEPSEPQPLRTHETPVFVEPSEPSTGVLSLPPSQYLSDDSAPLDPTLNENDFFGTHTQASQVTNTNEVVGSLQELQVEVQTLKDLVSTVSTQLLPQQDMEIKAVIERLQQVESQDMKIQTAVEQEENNMETDQGVILHASVDKSDAVSTKSLEEIPNKTQSNMEAKRQMKLELLRQKANELFSPEDQQESTSAAEPNIPAAEPDSLADLLQEPEQNSEDANQKDGELTVKNQNSMRKEVKPQSNVEASKEVKTQSNVDAKREMKLDSLRQKATELLLPSDPSLVLQPDGKVEQQTTQPSEVLPPVTKEEKFEKPSNMEAKREMKLSSLRQKANVVLSTKFT